MNQEKYRALHRLARTACLGSLTFEAGSLYDWFLTQVYDLRYPHVGDRRYVPQRTFDSLTFNCVQRLKWRRQQARMAQIRLCAKCKGYHHQFEECLR